MSSDNTNQSLSYIEKKRGYGPTWYEWIQLIATVAIAIGIGVMTFMQNQAALEQNSNALKIANENRLQDMAIANESRINDQLISEKNRKKDFEIAEQNRLADIYNALDQQRENILIEYMNFLTDLLMKENLSLSENENIRSILQFKTVIALRQLNSERKMLIIMTLYKTKLITRNDDTDAIINLQNVNLTNIQLGYPSEESLRVINERFDKLDLSKTILTKFSCICCSIRRSDFSFAVMNEIDFRRADIIDTVFYGNNFLKANFSYAKCVDVFFSVAIIRKASFRKFVCEKCVIELANFSETDLSEGHFNNYDQYDRPITMKNVLFNRSNLFQTKFDFVIFNSTNFVHNNMIQSQFLNCKFLDLSYILNNSFVNTIIKNTSFINTNINECDMSNSIIKNSSFSSVMFNNIHFNNANLERNIFFNVSFTNCDMQGASLLKSSFYNSSFINCIVSNEQLSLAASLKGSLLPNGTIVE